MPYCHKWMVRSFWTELTLSIYTLKWDSSNNNTILRVKKLVFNFIHEKLNGFSWVVVVQYASPLHYHGDGVSHIWRVTE